MSFFDDEIMETFKEIKSEFIKREEDKKYIEDPEIIKKIRIAAKEHHKTELEKDPWERWHYRDEEFGGYDVVLIKTHRAPRITKETGKAWNVPKIPKKPHKDYPEEYELTCEYPLMRGISTYPQDIKIKAKKSMFFKEEKGKLILLDIYNYLLLVRGEMYVTYSPLGTTESYFRNEFIKHMSKRNGVNYKSIKEIDHTEFVRYFTFRIHQTLESRKLED